MEEEFFFGMTIGFGMTLVYIPFLINSRVRCRQNVEKAENFYSLGEFGKAYNLCYPLTEDAPRWLLPFSIPRDVRERALELNRKIKEGLLSKINEETKAFLEGLEEEFEVDLRSGICFIPSKELNLSEISHTYKKYFEYQ